MVLNLNKVKVSSKGFTKEPPQRENYQGFLHKKLNLESKGRISVKNKPWLPFAQMGKKFRRMFFEGINGVQIK